MSRRYPDIRLWRKFFIDAGLGGRLSDSYAEKFYSNRISMTHLGDLTRNDLKEIGIRAWGDVQSILDHVKRLDRGEDRRGRKRKVSPAAESRSPTPPPVVRSAIVRKDNRIEKVPVKEVSDVESDDSSTSSSSSSTSSSSSSDSSSSSSSSGASAAEQKKTIKRSSREGKKKEIQRINVDNGEVREVSPPVVRRVMNKVKAEYVDERMVIRVSDDDEAMAEPKRVSIVEKFRRQKIIDAGNALNVKTSKRRKVLSTHATSGVGGIRVTTSVTNGSGKSAVKKRRVVTVVKSDEDSGVANGDNGGFTRRRLRTLPAMDSINFNETSKKPIHDRISHRKGNPAIPIYSSDSDDDGQRRPQSTAVLVSTGRLVSDELGITGRSRSKKSALARIGKTDRRNRMDGKRIRAAVQGRMYSDTM